MDSQNKQRQLYRSQLFTVRVWQEELGDGQSEWRGKGLFRNFRAAVTTSIRK